MGIISKIENLYRRANASFGRHGIIWALLLFVLPFVSAGAMAGYLASTAEWYWRHFGWLGVWIAVLLTWVLLGAALLVVRQIFDPALLRLAPPSSNAVKLTSSGGIKRNVNWAPWKIRARYTIGDFSRILCGLDPNGVANNESEAFKDTLIEQANLGKLKSHRQRANYTMELLSADWNTEIDKANAIAWAKANTLDVSHIEN